MYSEEIEFIKMVDGTTRHSKLRRPGDRNRSRWDDDRGRVTAAVDPASPDGVLDRPDGCFRMPAVVSVGRVGG
jgi:hypothetical protein